jgi:hypothetical protein
MALPEDAEMSERIDPNRAVDYLIEHSRRYAQARADRVHLEHFRKSKKATLMGQCDERAVTAREQYAYAHPEYIALLEGLRAAVEVEETLRWRLTAAQLRVEIWRSQEASSRGLDRAVR